MNIVVAYNDSNIEEVYIDGFRIKSEGKIKSDNYVLNQEPLDLRLFDVRCKVTEKYKDSHPDIVKFVRDNIKIYVNNKYGEKVKDELLTAYLDGNILVLAEESRFNRFNGFLTDVDNFCKEFTLKNIKLVEKLSIWFIKINSDTFYVAKYRFSNKYNNSLISRELAETLIKKHS